MPRPRSLTWVSILAVWLGVIATVSAAAPADGVQLRTTSCPDLDADELQRLLSLELEAQASAPDDLPEVVVGVSCDPEALQISVVAPQSGRRLRRELPSVGADHPARERVVALAVAELFETAWLDLLSVPPGWQEVPEPAEAQPHTESPKAPPPRRPPPRRDEVVVGASARLRHLPRLLPTGRLAIGYGGWLRPHWRILGLLDLEYGQARRDIGTVHALSVALGGRGTYRSPRIGRITFDVGATASLRYLRLIGIARASNVQSGSVQGLAADLQLSVGPTIHFDRTRLGLFVEGGYLVPGPRGRVTDERPARVDGGFVGMGLDVAITPRSRG